MIPFLAHLFKPSDVAGAEIKYGGLTASVGVEDVLGELKRIFAAEGVEIGESDGITVPVVGPGGVRVVPEELLEEIAAGLAVGV